MKAYKKIAIAVLITASLPVLIPDSVQFNQAYSALEKSDFLSLNLMGRCVQEKSKYKYVGSEKCASVCHNNEKMGFQYDIWKKSLHSESYKNLTSKKAERYARSARVSENPQESSVCLKCHVTGGDLDQSFLAVTYKIDDGVTCEACHKGGYIPRTFLPKETDCLKCHSNSVHRTHKFDFNDRFAKIVHPRPITKPM